MENQISKIPLKSRLECLEEETRDRLDFFGPSVISDGDKRYKFVTYELGVVAMYSLVVDKVNFRNISKEKWLETCCSIVSKQEYLTDIFDENTRNGIAAIALMQAYLKQYIMLIYRSNFLYNYFEPDILNLKKLFFEKFECDYSEFLTVFSCTLAYSKFKKNNQIYSILAKYAPNAMKYLSIDSQNFKRLYEPIYKWNDLSFINFNFLHRYPFIIHNETFYIPYWPSITYAITESLMFDITRDNDDLKTKIGKHAFEEYVYRITQRSKINEDCAVIKEIIYNKEHKHSSDIIVSKGENLVLVEVKFMNFKQSLRRFDEGTIDYTELRMVECIVQVYKNMISISNGEIKHVNIPVKIGFMLGVIVILDDFYLDYESIYKKAAISISGFSSNVTPEQLKEIICFTSLYEYERIQYYSSVNLIDFFYDILKVKKQYNFWQYNTENLASKGGINLKEVNDLYKSILEKAANIIRIEEKLI